MGAAQPLEPWDAYERISDDPADERQGVGRQVADTDTAVAARGGHVVLHHTENDTSAYKKRPIELTDPVGGYKYTAYRVIRPVWAEALRRLRTGEAQRLMVYDLDRLARDPRDLEDAIEVVEHYGAEIRSATASEIDLSTETGRMNARLLVMIANKSSADTARRVKRQKEDRLASGKPPGSRYRTFGYNVTKRAEGGKKPVRVWSVNEPEAEIVREVFERIAGGESVQSITKDLRARGVKRVSGEPWAYAATSRLIDSPIYCGWVSYRGQKAHRLVGVQPLVSEELYDAATARRDSARKPGRTNSRKHLLSGIAVCGRCLTPMTATGQRHGSQGIYVCNRQAGGCGNTTVTRGPLDRLIENAIKTGLFVESTSPQEAADAQERAADAAAEVDAEIASIDGRITQTQAALTNGSLDYEDGLPMLAELRKKRKALEADRTKVAEDHGEFLKPLADYEAAGLGERVAEVKRNLSAIIVNPTSKRGRNSFDPGRVDAVLTNGEKVNGAVLYANSIQFEPVPTAG